MMRTLRLLMLFVFSSAILLAEPFDHTHGDWSTILEKHVEVNGAISRFDYQALRQNQDPLNHYLEQLEAVTAEEYLQLSRFEKLAFLINAYNAFTVKLIVDHYPIASIKDLGGLFSSPWKRRFFSLLGKTRSLDEVEHEMIRRVFKEPRIHFALNCASLGCPALRQDAYRADRLDRQLEESSSAFLQDDRRNRYLPAQNRLEVSRIFKWYAKDFKERYGSVENFIASRITEDSRVQEKIRQGKVRISYSDYDWSLNDLKTRGALPTGGLRPPSRSDE